MPLGRTLLMLLGASGAGGCFHWFNGGVDPLPEQMAAEMCRIHECAGLSCPFDADADTGSDCERVTYDRDAAKQCVRELRKECPETLDGWEMPAPCGEVFVCVEDAE